MPILGCGRYPAKQKHLAMSDRLSDLDFKLQHVVLAVSDVAEWFDLGLQLGLPSATLRLIAADPNIKDIKSQRLAMLSEWLEYDTAASWEKLAAALATIGENVVAANVRSRFMKAATIPGPVVDASSQDDKTCQEMTQTVLRKIRSQFASLQVEVRSAMEARQVKVSDAHQFLVSFFQGRCCIPEAPDLTKLFNIITEAKLWCYDHYGPLEELAEKFLPDDNPARKLVSKYKNQLSGFYVATKIVDFIDLSELDDFEDDSDDDSEDDTQQSLSPKEYKKLYRELKVTLKLDRKIKLSEMTMSYVDTLWKALIKEFNLPPLTAIIKKIVGGSLIIIWLVPPQVSAVIAAYYSKALRFYQQHNIVCVELDNHTLYDEDWIVCATPLYQASFMGNTTEVKEMLEGGADVNQQNSNRYGETALFGACRGGHVETTRVLLDHEAHVDYQNEYGQSALWWASNVGETECVKVLVKYGAQVDLPDMIGNTALIRACQGGHVETARVLLDHGAVVDHQNNRGETALRLASYFGKSETVSLLLKAGAKTDIQEKDSWTSLMRASEHGHTGTILMFLEAKADPNITDEDGETALHWPWAARGGLCRSNQNVGEVWSSSGHQK